MDVNQYMGMFMDESREHLQTLNRCILELEASPGNLQLLDEIFRSAHTLKGMSATMGFHDVAEITHEMENILDLLRKGKLGVTSSIVDMLFKCLDFLEQLVEAISQGGSAKLNIADLVGQLKDIAAGKLPEQTKAQLEVAATVALQATATEVASVELTAFDNDMIATAVHQGMNAYEVTVTISKDCLLKAARAYLAFAALEDMGNIVKSVPEVSEIEKENFEDSFAVILVSDHDAVEIDHAVSCVSEISKVVVKPIEVKVKGTEPVDSNINYAPVAPQTDSKELSKNVEIPGQGPTPTQKNKVNHTVRVDIEKLDDLLNLVGELVINKTRLDQIGSTHRLTDLVETIEAMDRVTTDLQNVVMKVRMVPIGQVFNRFPRMIRDLARDLSKEINLVIQGEETELDRTVIDEIGDPLVHLLRNAIDHGIESPQDRAAVGKPHIGEVKLVARQEGNNVVIEVIDNGKGISPDFMRNMAVEKGLMSRAEADRLDNSEAIRIIFLPGFSTAAKLTDVSGRGVGMDVVRSKIECLGGTIEVDSRADQGSRFTIRLPLTLAIIQALLITLGEEKYAIPLSTIDSTIKIDASELKTIQNREVILLRDNVIPIVRLSQELQVRQVVAEEKTELYVVIVQMGEKRAGFIVDTLIGQQEVVIKSMGKLLGGIRCIAGATILGDGQVALILDVGTLMQ